MQEILINREALVIAICDYLLKKDPKLYGRTVDDLYPLYDEEGNLSHYCLILEEPEE